MIHIFVFTAGLLSFLFCLYQLIAALMVSRCLPYLKSLPEPDFEEDRKKAPMISVIISAKDEEREIEQALKSRLASDYPNLEIIVVNDRSSDDTGRILDRLQASDKRIRVLHLRERPRDWLGKLNALNEGMKIASGEWLLFSDGDVHIKKGTLARTVGRCERESIDFVAVIPDFRRSRFLIDLCVSIFFRGLLTIGRAYQAENPMSSVSVGSGSFNFVRRKAFEQAGGFAAFRMEVIDDVTMGQQMKAAGFRTSLMLGKGMVAVRWYDRFSALFHGMGRALMTGMGNFNLPQLLFLSSSAFILDMLPFILSVQNVSIVLKWVGISSAVLIILATIQSDRLLNRPPWFSLFLPLGYLLVYIIALYGGIKIWLERGLVWRDTYYPIKDLKKGRRFKYFP